MYYVLNAPTHFRQISSVAKKESVDAIVFANILAGTAAVREGSRLGLPTVCDYLDHYPESASAYYTNRAVAKIVAKAVSTLVGWNVRNSTMNVAISDSFSKILVEEYGVNRQRVRVIPNGVDSAVFFPTEREEALQRIGLDHFRDFLCLCYVGAIERWSRLEVVANTVDRLNKRGLRIALLIVGGGLGTNYYSDLYSRFRDRPYIHFAGFVSENRAALYMCAAHLCVLPSEVSKISAGLPFKLLEYLACRRPVLSTPIPEVCQALGNTVITYANVQELEEILTKICLESTNFSLRVERGYQFALSRSWERISQLYEGVLIDLMHNATKRAYPASG